MVINKFDVSPPRPCVKCGAMPLMFVDEDTLSVIIACPKCRSRVAVSLAQQAVNEWDKQNLEGDHD